MENVVFIDPSHSGSTEEFNCGLLSIGSYLDAKEYNVNLIFSSKDLEAVDNFVTEETLYVGISAMSTQIPEALKLAKYVKDKFPKIKVIFGGYHAILFPIQTLKHELIDYICFGDGEELCEELIHAMRGDKKLSEIKGVGYKENDELIFNDKRSLMDLSKLPRMNYELINKFHPIERSLPFRKGVRVKTGIVFSGNGCPFSCTFCINSAMQRKWQGRDIDHVLDEIEWLINEHEVDDIYLIDELFFVKKDRFFRFLDEIERRGLKFTWNSQCRADYINDDYLTVDVLKRMRELGGTAILFGVESGSDRMLKKMRKGLKLESVMRAVKDCGEAGIVPRTSFIIGMPGENRDDMLRTFRFILELYKINPNLYLHGPSIYRPYPGGSMYDELVESGEYSHPKKMKEWNLVDSSWNDRYLLDKSPWIKEKSLVLDIKDTLNVFFKFKKRTKFNILRAVMKELYYSDKMMKVLLDKLPYMDQSAKSLFRPDLKNIYYRLEKMTSEIDVLDNDEIKVENK